MDGLRFSLMIIGGTTIVGIVLLGLVFLWEFVSDKIRDLRWNYKYKHRFDKPPTAQCYCKDCKYYTPYSSFGGRCGRGHIESWGIADNYFCWQAEPLKRDPELRETKGD